MNESKDQKLSPDNGTATTSPKVSVVMCVYNDEKNIGKSIESILNQTFSDFELIIIDDGSTDKTAEVLESYVKKDSRIKVFHKENSGTTASANFGISLACGEYIARLDSDDISYPHRLQTEVDWLDKNPNVALIGGGADMIDQDDNIIGRRNIKTNNPKRTILYRNIYQQSDVMFKKSVFNSLGGYREKFKNGEDYDLWLRISEVADIIKINDLLGQWRLNAGGYSFSRRQEQLGVDKVIKQFALQRREKGSDDYSTYTPTPKLEHRQDIDEDVYKFWIAEFLLDSYRKKEARNIYVQLLKKKFSLRVLIFFWLTLQPVPALKFLNSIRNFLKNNF